MDEPRTVLLNDLTAHRQRSGVGNYVAQLLRHLPEADRIRDDRGSSPIRLLPLSSTLAGAPLKWASSAFEASRKASSGDAAASMWRRWLAGGVGFAKRVGHAAVNEHLKRCGRWLRCSVYHEPDALPLELPGSTVATVHDLSVLLFPEWHPAHRVEKYHKNLEQALARTQRFVTVSETTRRDLIQVLGVAPDRIDAVPLAPRPEFRVLPPAVVEEARRRWNLPERFALYVGTIEPRKNVAGLLRAYALLPAALRSAHPLVLVGGWGWHADDVRAMLDREPWASSVRWLGYLSDDDLVALTNAAGVFVYPSRYEGFGLPPVEAMACGCPVVTTTGGSLAEVVGDAAWTVDVDDDRGLAEALRAILEDPSLAADYRRCGFERIRRFSW
ncbi:MAG: glycosyltransferase family 4 protein, partial [Planctomycetia bacterium]